MEPSHHLHGHGRASIVAYHPKLAHHTHRWQLQSSPPIHLDGPLFSFFSERVRLVKHATTDLARDHNFSQAEVADADGIGRDWGCAWESVRVCGGWALSLSLPAFLRTSGSIGCGIRVDPSWPTWESESSVAACTSKPFSGEKPNSTSWPVEVARHSCAVGEQGLVTMWMGLERANVSVTNICAHISSNSSNMAHIWYHTTGMARPPSKSSSGRSE